jgi:hypothetical protein
MKQQTQDQIGIKLGRTLGKTVMSVVYFFSLSLSLFLICLGASTISKRKLEVGIDHMF